MSGYRKWLEWTHSPSEVYKLNYDRNFTAVKKCSCGSELLEERKAYHLCDDCYLKTKGVK